MTQGGAFTVLIIDARAAAVARRRQDLMAGSARPASVMILDASDEQAALSVVLGTTVDVILLTPPDREEDALAVTSRLTHAAPEATIVITTEAVREAAAFRLVQAGAQGYILTDIDDGRVMWRVIRQAVEREARARRREAMLAREHAARLAAEQAFQTADRARANAEAVARSE